MGHVIITLLFNRLALECNLGKFFYVKKAGGAKIVVAGSVIGIDAGRLNGHADRRFGDVLAVKNDLSLKRSESTIHGADHQVSYSKVYRRMVGVDFVFIRG